MMFEHRHELETTQRSVPGTRGREKQTLYRYRCTCGEVTGFRVDPADARKLRDRHAFDGQLSHTLADAHQ